MNGKFAGCYRVIKKILLKYKDGKAFLTAWVAFIV